MHKLHAAGLPDSLYCKVDLCALHQTRIPVCSLQYPDTHHEEYLQLSHQLNYNDDEEQEWMVLVFQDGPI